MFAADLESRLVQGIRKRLGTDFSIPRSEAAYGYELLPRAQVKLMAYSPTDSWGYISEAADLFKKIIGRFTISSLDEEVARLLEDEFHLSELQKQWDEDRRRMNEALSYTDFLIHETWLNLPSFMRDTIAEPNAGCSKCKDAHDKYFSQAGKNTDIEVMKRGLDASYEKLSSVFDEYKLKTWGRKPMARLSGYKNGDKIG